MVRSFIGKASIVNSLPIRFHNQMAHPQDAPFDYDTLTASMVYQDEVSL